MAKQTSAISKPDEAENRHWGRVGLPRRTNTPSMINMQTWKDKSTNTTKKNQKQQKTNKTNKKENHRPPSRTTTLGHQLQDNCNPAKQSRTLQNPQQNLPQLNLTWYRKPKIGRRGCGAWRGPFDRQPLRSDTPALPSRSPETVRQTLFGKSCRPLYERKVGRTTQARAPVQYMGNHNPRGVHVLESFTPAIPRHVLCASQRYV